MRRKLRELLDQDPFVPFDVVMASGDRFRIDNPSLITFVEDYITYFLPRSDGQAHLRLSQIVLLLAE
jgi:hypothetical protein